MTESLRAEPGPKVPSALTVGALVRKFAFPALLVVVLVTAACFVIDLRRLGELLLAARPWPLVALLACYGFSLLLHALRMRVLLRRAVSYATVFHADVIGNMVNSILPLRAGEFTFALLLSRRVPGGGAEVLSNVFVDRILALISILAIFLAALPGFSPHDAPTTSLANGGIYCVLAFGGIVLVMFLVTALEEPLVALARATAARLLPARFDAERLLGRLRALINGLRVLFHLRTSLPAFALALGTWAFIIAANYCGMLSVIPEPSVTAAVFVTFLTTVGIMLVPTPAGIGTMHGVSVLALSMFGVGAEQALAFAILCHALTTITNISLGMWSAHRMDFRLNRVLGRKPREASAGA